MTWYIAGALLLWTLASIWWAVYNLGEKYRKPLWYEWMLAPPVLLLALIFGLFNNIGKGNR